MVAQPDTVIALKAEVCAGCGQSLSGRKIGHRLLNRRQVFDLPPDLRFLVQIITCTLTPFPALVQYRQ